MIGAGIGMAMQSADELVDTVDLGGQVADFSLWGMFSQADIVVQSVMVLLILTSFWSWAIMFEKITRVRKIIAAADGFEKTFWSGQPLDKLFESVKKRPGHPFALVFVSAMREWDRAAKGTASAGLGVGLEDRITRVMHITIAREMAKLEKNTGFLATVGSTAPFVGLFGTVWGIMNSFQSIAMTANTSLAVVAPGIAEALAATALGLVAAIPAVVAYNKISNDLNHYAGRLEGFADEFSAIISRQLDEKRG